MERFDLYDKQGKRLGKTMQRGEPNKQGEYHLVVHIWIRHHDLYLIQQRNKKSDRIPYQWGCTSGAVLQGETSLLGAIREVEEELGIKLRPDQFNRLKRYYINDEHSNYITDVYLVETFLEIETMTLLTKEVKAVQYASLPQIKRMIKNKTFWDYERLLERAGYFTLLEKS